jgi:hypothetical protein
MAVQILFNRVMAQMGLSAFRNGLIQVYLAPYTRTPTPYTPYAQNSRPETLGPKLQPETSNPKPWRTGRMQEAHGCFDELCGNNRLKELLAQVSQRVRQESLTREPTVRNAC